ncbi:hypothetical protein [Zooshikella ganghwensis]|uniref:Uncharacterized protein n=1 Tax=Zooshikella ganghwensis TaxID=202772 RepID=A0A4P9VKH3_9GAMM|nr:hypothetical protein [Zooshikella ganghwensis]RDH42660.1 hypothetical protein B9G39_03930 [Zooshikella ganghwensis]
MNTMKYEELPPTLQAIVKVDDFLSAYSISDSKSVIVWVVNSDLGKQEELEFSTFENRLLSRKERESAMPTGETTIFSELGVEVLTDYKLEVATNVLYEMYKIFSVDSKKIIAEKSQIYFTPYKSTLKEIVINALDDYQFPKLYEGWDENEKINYWVEVLYRLRRQTGESGGHEDDIFNRSLIDQMMQVDSKVVNLLPTCLKRLANIEQLDEHSLTSAFEAKSGCRLK